MRAGRVRYFSGSETHTQFLLNNVKDKPESKEHENIGIGDQNIIQDKKQV